MTKLTLEALHIDLGISPETPGFGKAFGPLSRTKLDDKLTSTTKLPLTVVDIRVAACDLGVSDAHIRAVRAIEAPRGPFDESGKPSILFERHYFSKLTDGKFDKSHPDISGKPYGPGQYGAYSKQYARLYAACALDPDAAFRSCSWGAFQVMGDHAETLDYENAYEMAKSLVIGEMGHLRTFMRYVQKFGLVDELRACRPGDPDSCRAFAKGYNGSKYEKFNYHSKLAAAIS